MTGGWYTVRDPIRNPIFRLFTTNLVDSFQSGTITKLQVRIEVPIYNAPPTNTEHVVSTRKTLPETHSRRPGLKESYVVNQL